MRRPYCVHWVGFSLAQDAFQNRQDLLNPLVILTDVYYRRLLLPSADMGQIILVGNHAIKCISFIRTNSLIERSAVLRTECSKCGTDEVVVGIPKPLVYRLVDERLQFLVLCPASAIANKVLYTVFYDPTDHDCEIASKIGP